MKKPILSIHLMTYNHEKHIKQCLDSILQQNYEPDFEIIISDDASTDKTPEILREYKKSYPDIIDLELNKENKGIVRNYFDTLKRCNGEYVFDISGDDFLNHNSLNIMINSVKKYPIYDFIEFEYDEYYPKIKKIIKNKNHHLIKLKKEKYLHEVFIGNIWPLSWCIKTKCIKKNLSVKELEKNNISVEDFPIAIELLSNNCTFTHSPISVMTYRRIPHSASNIQDKNERIKNLFQYYNNALYYHKKYNFPVSWKKELRHLLHLSLLHTAGLFGDKNLGIKALKEIFPNINGKILLHFASSQSFLFRRFVYKFRRIN